MRQYLAEVPRDEVEVGGTHNSRTVVCSDPVMEVVGEMFRMAAMRGQPARAAVALIRRYGSSAERGVLRVVGHWMDEGRDEEAAWLSVVCDAIEEFARTELWEGDTIH